MRGKPRGSGEAAYRTARVHSAVAEEAATPRAASHRVAIIPLVQRGLSFCVPDWTLHLVSPFVQLESSLGAARRQGDAPTGT